MSVNKLGLFLALLFSVCANAQVFYGTPYTYGDSGTAPPTDYQNPVQPPLSTTQWLTGLPANAAIDQSYGAPVIKIANQAVTSSATGAFGQTVDEQGRFAMITTLDSTLSYQSKKIITLSGGGDYCLGVGTMAPGGWGYRDVIRFPYTGTLYIVNSVVTIVTSSPAFPTNKTLAGTDLIINGVKYQLATDDTTSGITLSQTGVNIGSAGSPVSFTAGHNDQDIIYGIYNGGTPLGQIVRVDVRTCHTADASSTTGPGQPSWEVWDVLQQVGSIWGSNQLFSRPDLCMDAYTDFSDDGNSFCVSDNTNGTGNAYDPRRYTLGPKYNGTTMSGTVSGPLSRYGWQTISSLAATVGQSTATIALSTAGDFRVGENVQVLSPNMCCSAAGAGGFKHNGANTCYIISVTDTSHFSIKCSFNFSGTISDTSGLVTVAERSAWILPPLPNTPSVGTGGDFYMQINDAGQTGNEAYCQAFPITSISRTSNVVTANYTGTPYPAFAVGIKLYIDQTTSFNATPANQSGIFTTAVSAGQIQFSQTGSNTSESSGNIYACGENTTYVVNTNTGATTHKMVSDAGHILYYVDPAGDYHVIQYADKYVNSYTQGYIKSNTFGCGLYDWDSVTDAITCMFDYKFASTGNEFYGSSVATRRNNSHPYVVISQTNNVPSTAFTNYTSNIYNNPGGLPTNPTTGWTISNISTNGTTVTMVLSTTPSPQFFAGDKYTISGTTNYNGTYAIAGGSGTTYTFAKTGSFATETAGTIKLNAQSTVLFKAAGTAGDCHSSGGTQWAYCSWSIYVGSTDGNVQDWTSASYGTIPLAGGTVTVTGGTHAGTQNYDWTQQWIYKTGSYPDGTTSAFVPRIFSGEIIIYDIVNKQTYHLLHHYGRQVENFYNSIGAFNSNAHVGATRNGKYICFDTSWGTGDTVGAYCAQVLRSSSSPAGEGVSGGTTINGGTSIN